MEDLMKLRHISLLGCALWMVILISSCNHSGDSPAEQASQSEVQGQVVPVEIHHIRSGEIAEVVTATGTIQPFREAYVSSEASGRITHINVEVGDRVQAGNLLVQLDNELSRLSVDQAEAQKLQTRATYEKAEKDLARHEKLFSDGSITEFELETAKVTKDVSESNYLLSDASLRMARRQFADTRITSPIAGIVAERAVDVGETVAPGTPVAKIVDMKRLRVKIGLSEEQIVKVHPGQNVMLTVAAYPRIPIQGEVFTVGPEASSDTRTFPVEITIPNSADYPLKSGMVARVELAVDVIQDVPIIPRDAILERAGDYIAFVINNTKAERRVLDLGAQSGDMVEIRRGITSGEDVVVIGQENLSDGTTVAIQNRRN